MLNIRIHCLLWTVLFSVLALMSTPQAIKAQETSQKKIILEVDGAIAQSNNGTAVQFDLEQLEAMGTIEIETQTPWTDGTPTFQGVPLSVLAEQLGATGSQVQMFALDNYSATIPASDYEAYGPILATRRDGEPLRIRDRGPLWVIYPWSDFPEIQNEVYYARAIWQVVKVTFE